MKRYMEIYVDGYVYSRGRRMCFCDDTGISYIIKAKTFESCLADLVNR